MTLQPCGIWVHIDIDVDGNHSTGDDKPGQRLILRQPTFVDAWDQGVRLEEEVVLVVVVVVVVVQDLQEAP